MDRSARTRRTPARRWRGALLAGVGIAVLLVRLGARSALASVGDADEPAVKPPAGKAAWVIPHRMRLKSDLVDVEGMVQDADQWQVLLSHGASSASASKKGQGSLAYVVNLDSGERQGQRLQRVALTAVSKDEGKLGELREGDWALQVQGSNNQRLSMTADSGELVYDAAYEKVFGLADGLEANVGFEAKRRTGTGIKPVWLRPSAGLRYTLPHAGETAEITLKRRNPDRAAKGFGVDYDMALSGTLNGTKLKMAGNPGYVLRTTRADGRPQSARASLKLDDDAGIFKGRFDVEAQHGKVSMSGTGGVAVSKTLMPGVELAADTSFTATPTKTPGVARLAMQPGLTASADMAQYFPSYVAPGSKVGLSARYRPGSSPLLSSAASLQFNPIGPLNLGIASTQDAEGNHQEKVKASATLKGAAARYEATFGNGKRPVQFGEVVYPSTPEGNKARFYGRFTQTPDDFGGEPRVQVGVQYDVDLGGKASLGGEGPVYDAGKGSASLIGTQGGAWKNPRPQDAHNVAKMLRQRIASTDASAVPWLE